MAAISIGSCSSSSSSSPSFYCSLSSSSSSIFSDTNSYRLNFRTSAKPSSSKKSSTSLVSCAVTVQNDVIVSNNDKEMQMLLPKIDKSGRFCSPRAARELALMILYASCLEGSDPVRLFEKRLNARTPESGYEFDKTSLLEYNHMSFGGPPVTAQTTEEADLLLQLYQKESEIEAEVLSAPPKLVYSKLILRFTRKLLVAVVEKWDDHSLVIDAVAPQNWKNGPAGRILDLAILHLAMSEIVVLGTRHQIVINEAVDLAKRFCDGSAPRVINGCLRTFVKGLKEEGVPEDKEITKNVLS